MDFVPIVVLTAMVYAFINFLKYLTNKQWTAALTNIVVWIAGYLAVLIFAHSDWASSVTIGKPLDELSGASLIIAGFVAGSTAISANQARAAFDRSDSSATPPLLHNAPLPPPEL
jgi:hypothetical protein